MMLSSRINPIWNEWAQIQSVLENSFWNGGGSRFHDFPSVNIYSGETETILTALLPGYEPDELNISVEGNLVKLKSAKVKVETGNGLEEVNLEFADKDFERTFKLPLKVDSEKVSASFKKGILKITLPKMKSELSKKIQIKIN